MSKIIAATHNSGVVSDYSGSDLVDAIRSVGIVRGDTVFFQTWSILSDAGGMC